ASPAAPRPPPECLPHARPHPAPHPPPPPPRPLPPPSGQAAPRPPRREGGPQLAHQPQPLAPPGVFGAGQPAHPGHREGTAAIDHTDGQYPTALAQGRRRDGQGQLCALPPAHYPAHHQRTTRLAPQLPPCGPAV